MRSKAVLVLITLFFVGLIVTPVPSLSIETFSESQVSDEPLYIYGDSDFIYYGFPGSGTEGDPYIIENLIIIGPSTCLSISSTNAHCIVRNCIFTAEVDITYPESGAVRIFESNNSRFLNCLISGGDIGFLLTDSYNIQLTGCNFTNNRVSDLTISGSGEYAIDNCSLQSGLTFEYRGSDHLDVSSSNTMIQDKLLLVVSHEFNTIHNGTNYGQIILLFCDNVTIRDFDEHKVQFPIGVIGSANCTLESIHLENETSPPILVSYSESILFVNCSFSCRGISFSGNMIGHWQHHYENVTVAERQLGFFESLENENLANDSYGQYILIDCYNVTIRDASIDGCMYPIMLFGSEYCDIIDCQITDFVEEGVELSGCSTCSVSGSSISGPSGTGLYVNDCVNISINQCKFNDSDYGILVRYSENCTTENSEFDSGVVGIYCVETNHTIICKNDIRNYRYGIVSLIDQDFIAESNEIEESLQVALHMEDFQNTRLENNSLSNNFIGFQLYGGISLSLFNNTVEYSTDSPLVLYNGWELTVESNVFHESHGLVILVSTIFCDFINNDIDNTGGVGISSSNNVDLDNNRISNSEMTGLTLARCQSINVHGSNITDNELAGIEVEDSTYCNIQ
ncbi:MAG: right-handed parallel beta-helix repeat-containing protein, partial [Candidatus Thorarchaeota archaeon]